MHYLSPLILLGYLKLQVLRLILLHILIVQTMNYEPIDLTGRAGRRWGTHYLLLVRVILI